MITARYTEEKMSIHSHFHDGYQLIYVAKGSARVTVSGRQYQAKAGTLVLISRLESHAIDEASPDYSRYTVRIAPQIHAHTGFLGDRLFSLLVNRPEQFRHCVDMSHCSQVESLLAAMARESGQNTQMEAEMLLFLLCQLLVLLCRAYPGQVPEDLQRLSLVTRIQRHIETNIRERLTLESIAQQFHLSQSYLSHLFKAITGSSIMGYCTAYRLQLAKGYLTQTDWEINRILDACGFTDNSNFSRIFKQSTGLTPSQFRKRYKE